MKKIINKTFFLTLVFDPMELEGAQKFLLFWGGKDAKWHVICLFSDVIYVNLVRYVFAFKAALRIFSRPLLMQVLRTRIKEERKLSFCETIDIKT